MSGGLVSVVLAWQVARAEAKGDPAAVEEAKAEENQIKAERAEKVQKAVEEATSGDIGDEVGRPCTRGTGTPSMRDVRFGRHVHGPYHYTDPAGGAGMDVRVVSRGARPSSYRRRFVRGAAHRGT